jgi:hypothetical protein
MSIPKPEEVTMIPKGSVGISHFPDKDNDLRGLSPFQTIRFPPVNFLSSQRLFH